MINQKPRVPPVQLRNGLRLAISRDGLDFKKLDKFLIQYGGVPCLITTPKGIVIAAFQHFTLPRSESSILPDGTTLLASGMAISKSSDMGNSWSAPTQIKLKGLSEKIQSAFLNRYMRPHGPPCDPAIVLLNDGKIRLYFTCSLGSEKQKPDQACTLSAISIDHENFNVEDGVRFMDEGQMILDPAVIRIGSFWHYYAPYKGGNYHATSQDGLNFKREPDITGKGFRFLGNASIAKDGYRFYTTYEGVSSAFSKDGYTWVLESGVRLRGPDVVGDVGVTRLHDQTYLMCYTAKKVK